MTTTSRPSPAVSTIARTIAHTTVRTMSIVSLLFAGIASTQAADDDDEDFNAIARKEKDPHHINDWRLGYSMLPAGADISIIDSSNDANPANYERETNWDLTGRTGLMWMTPWSGMSEDGDFIVGLELSTNHLVIESSGSSPEIDLRSYQLTLHPGLGWLLDDEFHIELNPYFGIGYAQFEQELAGDGTGLYWEVGFRAAGYYTWSNGVQLGLQIGYLYASSDGEIDGSAGTTYDTTIDLNGLTVGLQLGYRL